jgi:hypothetical protein
VAAALVRAESEMEFIRLKNTANPSMVLSAARAVVPVDDGKIEQIVDWAELLAGREDDAARLTVFRPV